MDEKRCKFSTKGQFKVNCASTDDIQLFVSNRGPQDYVQD